jgi:hypothetical protein
LSAAVAALKNSQGLSITLAEKSFILNLDIDDCVAQTARLRFDDFGDSAILMKKACLLLSCFLIFTSALTCAEQFSDAVVFRESGFPTADSAAPTTEWVEGLLPGARLASTNELAGLLKDPATRLLVLPYGSAFPEQAWDDIFAYLQRGGNLVVIGGKPFSRSGYNGGSWKLRDYSVRFMRPLMIDQYQTNAAVQLNGRSIPLAFNQQDQNWLEALRFRDGSTLKEFPVGKGRIFWAAYPVELAEGAQPAADLYSYVANKVGITPMFDLVAPLSPGVLVFPTVLQDSVLYVVVSDGAEDARVDLRDKLSGARITIPLASQHAALAVVGKQSKTVVAKYGY